MTLTSFDRVIINRMVIVNTHYHYGFDEVHTHNKQKLKYYRIKKEENTKAF